MKNGKSTLSVCMIVKDEEKMLPDALRSVKDCADEIILVDTGSSDRTIEVAVNHGCDIYTQKWKDDFSYHRNYSISRATKDWILILDADERMDMNDLKGVKQMLSDVEQNMIAIDAYNMYGDPPVPASKYPQLRFFRRSAKPRYEGAVHNKPTVDGEDSILQVPCKLYHYGYDLDPEKTLQKHKRRRRMLRKYTVENPEDIEGWYNLARALKVKHNGEFNMDGMGEIKSALGKVFKLCNWENDPKNIYIQSLYLYSVACYVNKDFDGAIEYAKKAYDIKNDYLDAVYVLGMAYTYGKDILEGEKYLLEYLKRQSGYNFSNLVNTVIIEQANVRARVYKALAEIEEIKERQNAFAIRAS